MTRRVKVACAAITPSGSEMRKDTVRCAFHRSRPETGPRGHHAHRRRTPTSRLRSTHRPWLAGSHQARLRSIIPLPLQRPFTTYFPCSRRSALEAPTWTINSPGATTRPPSGLMSSRSRAGSLKGTVRLAPRTGDTHAKPTTYPKDGQKVARVEMRGPGRGPLHVSRRSDSKLGVKPTRASRLIALVGKLRQHGAIRYVRAVRALPGEHPRIAGREHPAPPSIATRNGLASWSPCPEEIIRPDRRCLHSAPAMVVGNALALKIARPPAASTPDGV